MASCNSVKVTSITPRSSRRWALLSQLVDTLWFTQSCGCLFRRYLSIKTSMTRSQEVLMYSSRTTFFRYWLALKSFVSVEIATRSVSQMTRSLLSRTSVFSATSARYGIILGASMLLCKIQTAGFALFAVQLWPEKASSKTGYFYSHKFH